MENALNSVVLPAAGYRGWRSPCRGGRSGNPFWEADPRGEGGGETPAKPAPTLHVVVGFAAGHPLAPLEAPVVGVRQHHLHEDVVVGRGVEAGDVKAQERKHPPGEGRKNTPHARRAGGGSAGPGSSWSRPRDAPSVPEPQRPGGEHQRPTTSCPGPPGREKLGGNSGKSIPSPEVPPTGKAPTFFPGERAALPGTERPPGVRPPLPSVSTRPLPAYRPCLVMIISVWCRWNLSQRGRLQRKTCARSPGPAAGTPSAPNPPQEPDAAGYGP